MKELLQRQDANFETQLLRHMFIDIDYSLSCFFLETKIEI